VTTAPRPSALPLSHWFTGGSPDLSRQARAASSPRAGIPVLNESNAYSHPALASFSSELSPGMSGVHFRRQWFYRRWVWPNVALSRWPRKVGIADKAGRGLSAGAPGWAECAAWFHGAQLRIGLASAPGAPLRRYRTNEAVLEGQCAQRMTNAHAISPLPLSQKVPGGSPAPCGMARSASSPRRHSGFERVDRISHPAFAAISPA